MNFKQWLLKESFSFRNLIKIIDLVQKNMPNQRIVMSKYKEKPIVPTTIFKVANKPVGGLWYGFGNSWLNFINDDYQSGIKDYIYEIKINPSKILIIDSKIKHQNFCNEYCKKDILMNYVIDWNKVAKDFHGIECKGDGFYPWHEEDIFNWQQNWDVESGVIWDKSALLDSKLIAEYSPEKREFVPTEYLTNYNNSSN